MHHKIIYTHLELSQHLESSYEKTQNNSDKLKNIKVAY